MLSTLEISARAKPEQIHAIANQIGIRLDELEVYGHYKAKVSLKVLDRMGARPYGKLICVTGMTPTKEGDGKTTTSIGLTQALGALKKKVVLCLREPSLSPIFGNKGGATGCGYAQVLPMEDINLHFTGDAHAVAMAHNLLAAALENHIHHGNELKIDPDQILWRRVMDIGDRQLRDIVGGVNKACKFSRHKTGFDVTASSEVMAILALSDSIKSLKSKLSKITVALTKDGKTVTAKDLKVVGAMALLLKDAIKPNLVQTLEAQPVFIHAGPFANVSHGNNSLIATQTALRLANYVVTESGFATDLGLEKFFDIVCPEGGLKPNLTVLVVTVKALKAHSLAYSGQKKQDDMFRWESLKEGFANMMKHIQNIQLYGVPVIVAINRFPQDTNEDIKLVRDYLTSQNIDHAVSDAARLGSKGAMELGEKVLKTLTEKPSEFKPLYLHNLSIEEKILKIATEIYGAAGVTYTEEALKDLELLKRLRFENLPVNIAKTPYSFSDDANLKGVPTKWKLKVQSFRVYSGAGYVVAVCGKILLMPGLPGKPMFEQMDLTDDGEVRGLF